MENFIESINWPALSVWVFIAQLVKHCSANVEDTGSNPVESRKTFLRFNCDGNIFNSYNLLLSNFLKDLAAVQRAKMDLEKERDRLAVELRSSTHLRYYFISNWPFLCYRR